MSSQDLELADCLFHALKSAETYYAMCEADEGFSGEYSGRSYGNSYARGRDARGRYTSRDDGYSGYYPPMPMRSRYSGYGSYEDGMSMRY